MQAVVLNLAVAVVAGYVATKVTDHAQRALLRATPRSEKEREPDTPPSAEAAAIKLAALSDTDLGQQHLQHLKTLIHYGLGIAWVANYGLLRRYCGMGRLRAGIITGLSLSLIVDEALNPALDITPPARAYPASAHLRGVLTHLVYGLAVAATAEGCHWCLRRKATN